MEDDGGIGPDVGVPERQPRHVHEILPERPRRRRRELRVALGVLRVAMVREVEVTEPLGRDQEQEAAEPRHRIVDPARGEGGAVHGLVHRREQEDEENALDEEQRGPAGGSRDDGPADGDDRAQVRG